MFPIRRFPNTWEWSRKIGRKRWRKTRRSWMSYHSYKKWNNNQYSCQTYSAKINSQHTFNFFKILCFQVIIIVLITYCHLLGSYVAVITILRKFSFLTKWLNLPHSLIFKRENFGSIVEGIYRKSNLPERFVQWPVPTYERAWCKQHQEQTRNTKCYSRRVICTRCCRCYEVSQRGNHIDEENTRVHCKRNMRPNERQHAFALS